MPALMLLTEGKHFSQRCDVSGMARRIAAYEDDAAGRADYEEAHYELADIWSMIETLDREIPLSSRPSQV